MCKEGYVQYRCGCIGRQLGLEECRYRRAVKELKAAGRDDNDVNIITNNRYCAEYSGDKYYPQKHDCRQCTKNTKKR
jgi:hypothetical protein